MKFIVTALLLSLAATLHADLKAPKPTEKPDSPKKKPAEKSEIKQGQVTIKGIALEYEAKAATLPILKQDGKVSANVFYTSYRLKNGSEVEKRPVTFCFNGGPGSSSVWLHLGAFGPKKVDLPPDGLTPPLPPGRLVNNPYSLLDVTDLVFIDPVMTGFSRVEGETKASEFLGVREDITAVGEFIRLWLTREKRWRSPKFIAGESYGGIRGGGLAEHLQSEHRIYLNGLIVISGLFDYDVLMAGPVNDLPYQVSLPALTAMAHYHKKLPPDLQADRAKAIAEARSFAYGDYARALLLNAELSKEERAAIAKRLARLTGLTVQQVTQQKLRISSPYFREMLLRDKGLVLGAYDARVVGADGDESSQRPLIEPFMRVVGSVAAATMNAYLREELGYEQDLPYEILSSQPGWNHESNRYTSVNRDLATAMLNNPHLHVLCTVGWADLVTPPDNIIHSIRHLDLPDELRANIEMAEYDSGHMMYTYQPDHEKLHRDISTFIMKAITAGAK
jgi:carboxypeptidase C (cathepsin A)